LRRGRPALDVGQDQVPVLGVVVGGCTGRQIAIPFCRECRASVGWMVSSETPRRCWCRRGVCFSSNSISRAHGANPGVAVRPFRNSPPVFLSRCDLTRVRRAFAIDSRLRPMIYSERSGGSANTPQRNYSTAPGEAHAPVAHQIAHPAQLYIAFHLRTSDASVPTVVRGSAKAYRLAILHPLRQNPASHSPARRFMRTLSSLLRYAGSHSVTGSDSNGGKAIRIDGPEQS
jgi:hypothetical protein